jgi:hypothetical protein
MEISPLGHEETRYLTDQIAQRAYDDRKNIVWDITMGRTELVDSMLQDIASHGYTESVGLFVEVAPDTSAVRAVRRWWEGMEAYQRGESHLGGRYLPPIAIRQMAADAPNGGWSENRQIFELLKSKFTHWELWDSMVFPPQRVASSAVPQMT